MMLDEVRKGSLVVRLKGGDPGVFGRGGEEAEALAREGISFEIVPGVTAGVGVAAYAGIPLTHRSYSSSVHFSVGRSTGTAAETRVLYMAGKNIAAATRELLDSGLAPETPALAVEAGTWARQRTHLTTLGRLAGDMTFDSPLLIILGDVVRCHGRTNWFEKRPLFGKRILVPRSRDHEGKLASLLDEAGAEPVEFEPVSFVPDGSAAEAVRELSGVEGVHFADPQAAAIFMETLRDARLLAGLRVSAAGHFTQAALERRGIVADRMGGPDCAPVLWLGPGGGRFPMYREALREDERRRVEGQILHAVAFPSSASVRRTVDLLGREFLNRLPLFSMGPETSTEIIRQKLVVATEASPSTFAGLIDASIRLFSERPALCPESSTS